MDIGYYGEGRDLIELYNVLPKTDIKYNGEFEAGEAADKSTGETGLK